MTERLPRERSQTIRVRVPSSLTLQCGRCDERLVGDSVALYTRTSRDVAFEPWCVDCAFTLIQWAGVGATSAAVIVVGPDPN